MQVTHTKCTRFTSIYPRSVNVPAAHPQAPTKMLECSDVTRVAQTSTTPRMFPEEVFPSVLSSSPVPIYCACHLHRSRRYATITTCYRVEVTGSHYTPLATTSLLYLMLEVPHGVLYPKTHDNQTQKKKKR